MEEINFLEIGGLNLTEEYFQTIIKRENIRIERIVSAGHKSPDGYWYNQEENEAVLLIKGEAIVEFEVGKEVFLKAGSFLDIPKKVKHRVKETSLTEESIWLAIFY